MNKIGIAFAAIGARDDGLTGYKVAALTIRKISRRWGSEYEGRIGDDGEILSDANIRTQAFMNREYLVRLKQLQNEIAAKYLPLFDADGIRQAADREDFEGTTAHLQADVDARREFPGEEADYYT
jgi:hypothetical protein